MKSMSRALLILAATALVATGFATRAEATTISVIPSAAVVNPGDAFSVSIKINGAPEAIGGAAFQLLFDSLVTGTGYVPPSTPGTMGVEPFDLSLGFTSVSESPFDFYVVGGVDSSFAFLDTPVGLYANQNNGGLFTLATVNFLAGAGGGPVSFSLENVTLSNFDGTDTLRLGANDVTGGSLRITGDVTAAPVPEPTTMLLLGTGLVAAAARRRRQNKSQL